MGKKSRRKAGRFITWQPISERQTSAEEHMAVSPYWAAVQGEDQYDTQGTKEVPQANPDMLVDPNTDLFTLTQMENIREKADLCVIAIKNHLTRREREAINCLLAGMNQVETSQSLGVTEAFVSKLITAARIKIARFINKRLRN